MDIPLFEDDLSSPEVISPSVVRKPRIPMPERVVYCFFSEIVDRLAQRPDVRLVETLTWAHGPHPVLEVPHRDGVIGVVHAGVGAPLAAGLLEETIALGGRAFVAVGGCGALLPDLVMGQAIVVSSAVRDEGTSFHYQRPGRVINADPECVAAVESTLEDASVPFVTGRTWTTDGVYREARSRVERRVAQDDCLCVEMEASALMAVASYRNVTFASLLYAGDSLAGDEWDHRGWHTAEGVREAFFWLAADAALRMPIPD